MTDRAITQEALLAGLRDIHLPSSAPGGVFAEALAAAAFAGCLAVLVAVFVRLFGRRVSQDKPITVAQRLAELVKLPEAERRVAVLHLLKTHAPDRFDSLQGSLYKPSAEIDYDAIEQDLARHG